MAIGDLTALTGLKLTGITPPLARVGGFTIEAESKDAPRPAADAARVFYDAHAGAAASVQTQLAAAEQPSPAERTRQEFLDYVHKSPIERLRDQVLGSLGLSEDSLAAMAPDERAAIEDKIRKLIEEKIREAMKEKGLDPDGPRQAADVLA